MKKLDAIRLINWYHFVDETLRLDGSCLLMGDNGSGKSTILDAVQLALVADLGEIRFNKAANENSRRNLHGYVRYKLGSEDESRPGQVRHGRGSCTSYVLLRFVDARAPGAAFVCGVVMEATEADTSVSKSFFVVPGVPIDEVPILRADDTVQSARDLRAALRLLPGAKHFGDVGTYRDELRHRLGPLPPSFHRLIVKGLDFKPIGRVNEFVLNYLLDERSIDTVALQSNLEHYKRLEGKAKEAEGRLAELSSICEQGERIAQERKTAESHRFMALRAEAELAEHERDRLETAAHEATTRKALVEVELSSIAPQLDSLKKARDRIMGVLRSSGVYQKVEELESELKRARESQEDAEEADAKARRTLAGQLELLDLLASEDARDLARRRPEALRQGLFREVHDAREVEPMRAALRRDGALAGRDLRGWQETLDDAQDTLTLAAARLEDQVGELREEGKRLERERDGLERGRFRYPDPVDALLHLLRTKLKWQREPQPLCELVEVRNERWRNAVEGFLGQKRFDVIVAPGDFSRALALYERHKHGYPLPGRGEIRIHGVGLVDTERVRTSSRRSERGSLAEQIETEDEHARAYADMLLGDVICCDSEQQLRQHRRAITDTVMVYQSYTARQTDPRRYEHHVIGPSARARRIEAIHRRLAELSVLVVELDGDLRWLRRAREACRVASADAARLPELLERGGRLATLHAQVVRLERELASMDRREIRALQEELSMTEKEQQGLSDRQAALNIELGGLKSTEESLVKELGGARERLDRARAALLEALSTVDEPQRAAWDQRYLRERAEREPGEIRDTFERQRRNIASRVENLVHDLIKLKTAYVQRHNAPIDVGGDGYEEFATERDLWRDSRLPEYREKITGAKEAAIQQLAEDIIFRLRENLLFVRRQIDELNKALGDVPFGSERYQFLLEVRADHRNFHELIMAAGSFEKDSLFGAAALSSHETRATLSSLFDRLVEGQAREVKTELESLADYREYFDYDIKIRHADGSHSRYNRVAGDRSGGETQTPFYIAIFASMYRLYRQLSHDGKPTCGLLLLDEVFSKMDGARIEASLNFARNLGLQLLLALPKERCDLVAPHVERTMYIYKDVRSGAPSVLDFTKEFRGDAPSAE